MSEIFFKGKVYPTIEEIPEIRPFYEVRGVIYGRGKKDNRPFDIVSYTYEDLIFLTYRGAAPPPSHFTIRLSEYLAEKIENFPQINRPLIVVDVGTETGAISIILAKRLERGNIILIGTDNSGLALDNAVINARLNEISEHAIEWKKTDGLEDVIRQYGVIDVMISNPPFLDPRRPIRQREDGFIPDNALIGGDDGTFFYRRFTEQFLQAISNFGISFFQIPRSKELRILSAISQEFPRLPMRIFDCGSEKFSVLALGNLPIIEPFDFRIS